MSTATPLLLSLDANSVTVAMAWLTWALLGGAVIYAAVLLYLAAGIRLMPRVTHATSPRVTVVVAARNEAERISECLASLVAQDYPADAYDVVMVDDGSTDDTLAIARRFEGDRVQIVQGNGHGKKHALALAFRHATGDIVLATDGDCIVTPRWMSTMVDHMTDDVGLATAGVHPGRGARGLREGWEMADVLFAHAGIAGGIGHGSGFRVCGGNMAIRRDIYDNVGGYDAILDEPTGDDLLLLTLVMQHTDSRVTYVHGRDAMVKHPLTPSWRALVSQRARYVYEALRQSSTQTRHTWMQWLPIAGLALLTIGFAVSPFTAALGWADWRIVVAAWCVKLTGECVITARHRRVSDYRGAMRWVVWWSLTFPWIALLTGALGLSGRFTWKGRPAGKSNAPPATNVGDVRHDGC